MVETIFTYFLSVMFFLNTLVIYVFLTAYLLPKIFIRAEYKSEKIHDRGIKKYLFENGRAIVYEPTPELRKFICQYILSDIGGERYLQCKVEESVKKIEYRILTFDAFDKPLGAFEVRESDIRDEVTEMVDLPCDTAYVSIELKEVNNDKVCKDTVVGYSATKIAVFAVLTILATVCEALIVKKIMLAAADLLFNYSDMVSVGFFFTVINAIVLGMIVSVLVFLTKYSKDYRINK